MGPNVLTRGPLAAGAFLSMRAPESAGCRFDIRLVLADGREAIRRDADVCQDRSLVVGGDGTATNPRSLSVPQPGGSDRLLAQLGGRD